MRRLLGIILLAVILLAYGATLSFAIQAQTFNANEKGPAANELIYTQLPLEQVPYAIGKKIDLYLFGLTPQIAAQLPSDVKIMTPPSGLVDFILNPAPVYIKTYNGTLNIVQIANMEHVPVGAIISVKHENGKTIAEFGAYPGKGINPFAFRKVRFAMNYLVDRKYIIQSVYRNYAVPMYTFLSIYDPTYTIIADIVAEYQTPYDPTLAKKLIYETLTAAGAQYVNGKWYYDNKPIEIKFIIRTEDERKQIGDIFANALEQIGFTVDRLYMEFSQAIAKVYYTDPMSFQWHIYTEGWGKGVLDKWDSVSIAQFGAPWFGYMPGWGDPSYWNYENSTIDKLTLAIFQGTYTSKQEYINLYRNATLLIINEAVRIWVATRLEIQPYASYLTGVVDDLGSGLRSPINLRTIDTSSGIVRIGHRHVWTASSIWNDWGGFRDVYSVDIMRATTDPSDWRNPYNGEPIPFRVNWTNIEIAKPGSAIQVPSNAVIWDASKGKWVEVGAGVNATSKVTYDFSKLLGTKWHDGITITWADIVGMLAMEFDLAYNKTKVSIEPVIAQYFIRPWTDTIKGFVFHWDTGKVDVYLDYRHFDPNYVADYGIFAPSVPTGIDMIEFILTFDLKEYGLSKWTRNANAPVLSLVYPEAVKDVKKIAEKLASEGKIPEEFRNMYIVNGKTLLTDQEFVARMKAIVNWINEHGNAWISDGPFYLDKMDIEAQQAILKAFRDPTYPFTPKTWLFKPPVFTKIESVNAPSIIIGKAYSMTVKVSGEEPLHLEYLFISGNQVLEKGYATEVSPGTFVINITADKTAKLQPYTTYKFYLIAYSDAVALPDTATIEVTTIPKSMAEMFSGLQTQINSLTSKMTTLQQQMAQQIEKLRTELASQLGEQVSSAFKQLSASITNLTTTLRTSIGQLSSSFAQELSKVNTRINTLQTSLTALQSDISSVKSQVSELSSSISDTKSTLGTLEILNVIVIILVIISIIVAFVKRK